MVHKLYLPIRGDISDFKHKCQRSYIPYYSNGSSIYLNKPLQSETIRIVGVQGHDERSLSVGSVITAGEIRTRSVRVPSWITAGAAVLPPAAAVAASWR
jgi:hypothetical protein